MWRWGRGTGRREDRTLDAEGCYALVDGIEGVFCVGMAQLTMVSRGGGDGGEGRTDLDELADVGGVSQRLSRFTAAAWRSAYLGENVVRRTSIGPPLCRSGKAQDGAADAELRGVLSCRAGSVQRS